MSKPEDSSLSALERFSTTFIADFRFGPLNIMILVCLCLGGLIAHLVVYDFSVEVVLTMIGTAIGMAVLFRVAQVWEAVLIITTVSAVAAYLYHKPESWIMVTTISVAGVVAPCIQIAYQWEKSVLLRFGQFKGLKGPGVYPITPVIDKVANYVDQRIRVTDFSAETTLTRDTVPVNVDAIAFWMVWDAKKCVLELENYAEAVVLSAQTGLRNAIGKNDLGDLLSYRDKLGEEIRQVLDEKSNGWGITVQSVEIRDIIIPAALEDAMSRQAQAERERQSRIILSTAETEIAAKFSAASDFYKDNPEALHLRAMNMVYEGLKAKGSMIIVPSTAVETMGLGALGGLTAFDKGSQSPDVVPHGGSEAGGAKEGRTTDASAVKSSDGTGLPDGR